jgi:hypothetical protein
VLWEKYEKKGRALGILSFRRWISLGAVNCFDCRATKEGKEDQERYSWLFLYNIISSADPGYIRLSVAFHKN